MFYFEELEEEGLIFICKILPDISYEHFVKTTNNIFTSTYICLKALGLYLTGKPLGFLDSIYSDKEEEVYELYYECLDINNFNRTNNEEELCFINKHLILANQIDSNKKGYYVTSLSNDLLYTHSHLGLVMPEHVNCLNIFFRNYDKQLEDIICSRLSKWNSLSHLNLDWLIIKSDLYDLDSLIYI